jgi:hypothetical protein
MKSTVDTAVEVLLNLNPLDLLIIAEAKMALYRLQILKQPADYETEGKLLYIWKNVIGPTAHQIFGMR